MNVSEIYETEHDQRNQVTGRAINLEQVRLELDEELNKLGLASIFDPAITDGGVDGCRLNVSVTRLRLYRHLPH